MPNNERKQKILISKFIINEIYLIFPMVHTYFLLILAALVFVVVFALVPMVNSNVA